MAKNTSITMIIFAMFATLLFVTTVSAEDPTPGYKTKIPENIMTPDKVKTSIGTLKFLDGAPSAATAEKVYDYLDRMRGVDTFLKGMPGCSLQALIKGNRSLGAVECHQVMITDKLMDSKSLFLTGNTNSFITNVWLDFRKGGLLSDNQFM